MGDEAGSVTCTATTSECGPARGDTRSAHERARDARRGRNTRGVYALGKT